jgi:hypothetical protein
MPRPRRDYLGQLKLLVLAVAMLQAAAIVFDIADIVFGSHEVRVPVLSGQAQAPDVAGQLTAGVTVDPATQLTVLVRHPSAWQTVLDVLVRYPHWLWILVSFILLWRILAKVTHADPFTADTVRRLRILGWFVLAGGAAAAIASFLATVALVVSVAGDNVHGSASLEIWPWALAGIGVLALTEIMSRGQLMRAELNEVI